MSYGNRERRSGGYGYGRSGGFTDYRSRDDRGGPKPVEVGKEYEVEISELSRRGDGLAKIQGFVVFVKGSKVGEKVKIKVETVGPRFATASVVGKSETKEAESSSGSGEQPAEQSDQTDSESK